MKNGTFRIVLRHHLKNTYYDGAGGWVANPSRALNFTNAIRALHYCALNRLQAEVSAVLARKADANPQSPIDMPTEPGMLSPDQFGRRNYE